MKKDQIDLAKQGRLDSGFENAERRRGAAADGPGGRGICGGDADRRRWAVPLSSEKSPFGHQSPSKRLGRRRSGAPGVDLIVSI